MEYSCPLVKSLKVCFNTYRGWPSLIVRDSKSIIFSCEGVIQGDPPAMFMYAISTVSLVQKLKSPSLWRQLWYVDNASVIGDTHSLKVWLDKLMEIGLLFGHIPEPTKSTLIVKESSQLSAEQSFQGSSVMIASNGSF